MWGIRAWAIKIWGTIGLGGTSGVLTGGDVVAVERRTNLRNVAERRNVIVVARRENVSVLR